MFISSLSIGEIQYGIQRLPDGKKRNDLQDWLNQVNNSFSQRILSITVDVCITWAIMRATAESKGLQLSVIDGLLAATAKEYDLILVTRNVKDFESTDVLVLNPWK